MYVALGGRFGGGTLLNAWFDFDEEPDFVYRGRLGTTRGWRTGWRVNEFVIWRRDGFFVSDCALGRRSPGDSLRPLSRKK